MLNLIKTEDGSHTVFVPGMDEHYHSVHGAIRESEIVFLKNGYHYCTSTPLRIFEAGLGTGLNALLTAIRCTQEKRLVYYTAAEKFPLPGEITERLNYPSFAGKGGKAILDSIHSAPWGEKIEISEYFHFIKIICDLTVTIPSGEYDLIYFDAFGPDKQPEMWTEEVISGISRNTAPNGTLVTYSVKGSVKRVLKSCGFSIYLLPGPPGKREVMRAVRNL